MNKKQMIALWVAIILFALIGIFPPQQRRYEPKPGLFKSKWEITITKDWNFQ